MSRTQEIEVLNRVLSILDSSLPNYLNQTSPWLHPSKKNRDERAREVLADMVTDQRSFTERITRMIQLTGEQILTGKFPMDYTKTNDLSLEYLLKTLVHYQKQDVKSIEACFNALPSGCSSSSLIQETLGSARAHLDALEELTLAKQNN